MSDEHNNKPRIPIQKSMSTNETRSMPMNDNPKPEDYVDLFKKIKDRRTKK